MFYFSAFTWNKKPPNLVKGILGENVTLEWNYTLSSTEKLDYFLLLEGGYDMIIFTESNGASIYDSYRGRVILARNGTPSFTLINLKMSNDGKQYCLKVSTKESVAKINFDCTLLKILGKVKFKLSIHAFFAFYLALSLLIMGKLIM